MGASFDRVVAALEARGCLQPHLPGTANGHKLMARCPAHDDHHPSLSVTHDGDKTLIHCHAACREDEVLAALGLLWPDLFDDDHPFLGPGPVGAVSTAAQPSEQVQVVALEDFAAVDEPGAEPLLGDASNILIPTGADVMVYGNGGAGKTTLTIDLALHLAAGVAWLGIPVPRPVRVLFIENEGPRPLLRAKLRRKLAGWSGPPVVGRISVLERPWGEFTFAEETWRQHLTSGLAARDIDVLIAGPLTRLGMAGNGTLQEVAEFMDLVGDVRKRLAGGLTTILVHHENKGGSVSGAWEGAGDTLLHITGPGHGLTLMQVQKARWDSQRHGKTLRLKWAGAEGFEVEADTERDLMKEITDLLSDGTWRTVKEIGGPKDAGKPGIGANIDKIRTLLEANPDRFEARTGDGAKEVGRSPTATVWQVTRAAESPESPRDSQGDGEGGDSADSGLKGVSRSEPPPPLPSGTDSGGRVTPRHPAETSALVEAA